MLKYLFWAQFCIAMGIGDVDFKASMGMPVWNPATPVEQIVLWDNRSP